MDLRKKSHEIRSIKYGHDIQCLLNLIEQETFEKSLMKSGPSNMILMRSIYEAQLIRRQSKMFNKDLRKKSHETRSIKYGPGMQYLLNMVLQESIENVKYEHLKKIP